LPDITVNVGISKAFADLKSYLLKNNCVIVEENPPTFIAAKQGSVWGVSPRNAGKIVRYRFSAQGSGTLINSSSVWTSNYKKLTLVGSVLAILMLLLCFWIFVDLKTYLGTNKLTFWSWLVSANGMMNVQITQLLTNLTEILTVFLAVTIVAEGLIVLYAHTRIEEFATESLSIFPKTDRPKNS
jgi:hypothetical protein